MFGIAGRSGKATCGVDTPFFARVGGTNSRAVGRAGAGVGATSSFAVGSGVLFVEFGVLSAAGRTDCGTGAAATCFCDCGAGSSAVAGVGAEFAGFD